MSRWMVRKLGAAVTFAAGFLVACGAAPLSLLDPSQPRDPESVVAITATGVQPQTNHLNHPVTVMFINRDTVAHTPEQAPELGYGNCPEIAQAGQVAPGATGNVTIDKGEYICGYHDAAQPNNMAFKGLIVVH